MGNIVFLFFVSNVNFLTKILFFPFFSCRKDSLLPRKSGETCASAQMSAALGRPAGGNFFGKNIRHNGTQISKYFANINFCIM